MSKKDVTLKKIEKEIAEAREDVKKGRVFTAQQIRRKLRISYEPLEIRCAV
ncbi:MAG: hypothetical protein HY981_02335 [Candidatus Magasanikbacteria bacterium]|nr:hypothetical protein [Candidatus Magasanikbacteria bacterium]